MPRQHTVQQGECLSSIAAKYGVRWQSIWDDPSNAGIKAMRKNPNILNPGDVLVIGDQRQRSERCQTDAAYRFVLKVDQSYLRLLVLDQGTPMAGCKFKVTLDSGASRSGTTDAKGRLEVPIPAGSMAAKLLVEAPPQDAVSPRSVRTINLKLGSLDPVTEVSGIQARLNNLGYNCGKVDGIFGKKTRAALNLFRKTVGLPLSAKIDAAATSKLEEVHDLGHVEQCRADEPDQPGDAMEEGI